MENEGYLSTVLYKDNMLNNFPFSYYPVDGMELNQKRLLWKNQRK